MVIIRHRPESNGRWCLFLSYERMTKFKLIHVRSCLDWFFNNCINKKFCRAWRKYIVCRLNRQFFGAVSKEYSLRCLIVLNNGHSFKALFCSEDKQLHLTCDIIQFIRHSSNGLLFTYDRGYMIYLSVLDTSGIETSLLNIKFQYASI